MRSKKITLHRETLRALDVDDLEQVAAGAWSIICVSAVCASKAICSAAIGCTNNSVARVCPIQPTE